MYFGRESARWTSHLVGRLKCSPLYAGVLCLHFAHVSGNTTVPSCLSSAPHLTSGPSPNRPHLVAVGGAVGEHQILCQLDVGVQHDFVGRLAERLPDAVSVLGHIAGVPTEQNATIGYLLNVRKFEWNPLLAILSPCFRARTRG